MYPLRNLGAGLPPGGADGSRRRRLGRHGPLLRWRWLLLQVLLLRPQKLLLLLSLRLEGRGRLHGLKLDELAAVPYGVLRGRATYELLLAGRRRLHGRGRRQTPAAVLSGTGRNEKSKIDRVGS